MAALLKDKQAVPGDTALGATAGMRHHNQLQHHEDVHGQQDPQLGARSASPAQRKAMQAVPNDTAHDSTARMR